MFKKVVLLVSVFLLLFIPPAQAVELNEKLFDDKVQYDIYLRNNDDDYSVIVNVEIVRVEEILGRRFLVVRPHEFTLNSADGFVAFDAIQAILPSRQIKVRHGEKLRLSY